MREFTIQEAHSTWRPRSVSEFDATARRTLLSHSTSSTEPEYELDAYPCWVWEGFAR